MEVRPRPSSSWKDPADALEVYDGVYRERITSFVSGIPWDRVQCLASSLRKQLPCVVIRERYTWGFYKLVLELIFEDGVAWVIRLSLPPISDDPNTHSSNEARLSSEVATISLVRERTTIPVPGIIAYSLTADNDIGIPYIIQEAVIGFAPSVIGLDFCGVDNTLPRAEAERYMRQLAEYHLQLSTIRFQQIGSIFRDEGGSYRVGPLVASGKGPYSRSIDFYLESAESLGEIAHSVEVDSSVERQRRLFVAWLYRTGVVNAALAGDGDGPFLLAHNDLHQDNTIVDKQGNILAVLDWDAAASVPVELFAIPSPHFAHAFSPIAQYRERTCTFNKLLSELEQSHHLQPSIPSGRSFAQLHTSADAWIAFLGDDLEESDCHYGFAEGLFQRTFGKGMDLESGFRVLTESPLFESWLERVEKRSQSQ